MVTGCTATRSYEPLGEEHLEERGLERQHPLAVARGALGEDRHPVAAGEARRSSASCRFAAAGRRSTNMVPIARPISPMPGHAPHLRLRHQERRRRPLQRHDVDPARMVGDEGPRPAHRVAAAHEAQPERRQRQRRPGLHHRSPSRLTGRPATRSASEIEPAERQETAKSPASTAAAQSARSAEPHPLPPGRRRQRRRLGAFHRPSRRAAPVRS